MVSSAIGMQTSELLVAAPRIIGFNMLANTAVGGRRSEIDTTTIALTRWRRGQSCWNDQDDTAAVACLSGQPNPAR